MTELIVFLRNLLRMIYFVRGVMLGLLLVLVICAFITAEVENMPLADALYFTFITALTVGYGDITPKTGIGRIISVLIAVVGAIIIGLIVAVSSRALKLAVEQEEQQKSEKDRS